METIVADLANQQAELSELLTGLDDAGWARPSPCEGWTVADVVLHLAQTNELAVASARGRFDEGLVELTAGLAFTDSIDDGADLMVARDRGAPAPLVADRWRASADALDDALRQCDPSQRLMWVAGDLSARTLASTRLAETWIHTGDVASGLGRSIVRPPGLAHAALRVRARRPIPDRRHRVRAAGAERGRLGVPRRRAGPHHDPGRRRRALHGRGAPGRSGYHRPAGRGPRRGCRARTRAHLGLTPLAPPPPIHRAQDGVLRQLRREVAPDLAAPAYCWVMRRVISASGCTRSSPVMSSTTRSISPVKVNGASYRDGSTLS
jgi:uncharacterized protein (TIGR03083 family)